MKVKLTNPATCKAIYLITKDPNHRDQCPIIMEKDIWLAIRPSVMLKKQESPNLESLFDGLFGNNNPWR